MQLSADTGITSDSTRQQKALSLLWTAKNLRWKDIKDFLNGEVRYNSLARFNPEKAEVLFAKNESEAKDRYEYLKKLVTLYGAE